MVTVSVKSYPNIRVEHVKAHTGRTDSEATRLNAKADTSAKAARSSNTLIAPPPHDLDAFALHNGLTGEISNGAVVKVLEGTYDHINKTDVFKGSRDVVKYFDKDLHKNAVTSAPLKVQLQVRSSALPTPKRIWTYASKAGKVDPNLTDSCRKCDTPTPDADERHIFSQCSGTEHHRRTGANQLRSLMQRMLKGHDLSTQITSEQLQMVDLLFTDNRAWDTGETAFWLGILPKAFPYRKDLDAMYNRIAGHAIKVTAKIWNDYTH